MSDIELKKCDIDKTLMKEVSFESKEAMETDICYYAHLEAGSITVLDRLTGYGFNTRDVETGFRSPTGLFWLVSGDFDIRTYEDLTVNEAIKLIKENANTCIPTTEEIERENEK